MKFRSSLSSAGKDALVTFVLGALAILASVGAGWVVLTPQGNNSDVPTKSFEEEIAEVRGREILDSAIMDEDTKPKVIYAYVGDRMPEKLSPEEVVGKRTERSYTRDLGPMPDGSGEKVQTVFFPRTQFVERGDGWHYVEYSVVSKEGFEKANATPVSFFVTKAHAALLSVFSGAGDGFAKANFLGDGNTADAVGQTTFAGIADSSGPCGKTTCPDYTIYRTFLPFTTSSIPTSNQVQSATLNVFVITGGVQGSADYITVVQTAQASSATLAPTDFSLVGSTEGIDTGERKTISGITANAYLVFTLNSTGLSWIKKSGQTSNCGSTSGVTCLGLRGSTDMAGAGDTGINELITINTSEKTGTANDPFLSVTYALPFSFWQFQDY